MPYTNTNINDKGQVGIKKFGIDPLSGLVPPVNSLIFTVDTTKAGTAADTFELSLTAAGAISMDVYWGDATMDTITAWNQAELTHVYPAPGVYTVSIANEVRGLYFNFGPDNLKILNISNWGEMNFTNIRTFTGCSNLTCNATNIPTISTSDMTYTFGSCTLFNGDVTDWDVSGVTNMQYFFVNNTVFTGVGLSSWDVTNVTNMQWMFGTIAGSVFNANISGWNINNLSNMEGMFYGTPFNQDLSGWNTAGSLTNINRTFQGATAFDQDLSNWDVSNVIDYADFLLGATLSTANYDALLIGWDAQAVQAAQVPDFGNSIYTNCAGAAFTARENLISSDGWTVTDGGGVPAVCPTPFEFSVDTTAAGSANDTFILPLINDGVINILVDWGDATTDTITTWNQAETTHVYAASGTYTIQMTGTIRGWQFDNGGDKLKMEVISEWGDMNVTASEGFYGCSNLTCTATDAPTVSGTDLRYMFLFCTHFNGDVDNWDMSAVTVIRGFFGGTAFNHDLTSWNTSSVTDMGNLFDSTTAFDSDISNWDTSNVTSFNQMFYSSVFNQDISAWNTGNVTTFYNIFRANTVFNQDISGWNTGSATNMGNMFNGSTSFDQDISGWNVSSATNMWGIFRYATAFDQDLGGWDISNVNTMDNFIENGTLSTANYDSLLLGWDALAVTAGNVPNFGNSIYTNCGAVETARNNLISSDTWTITDGGGVPAVCATPFTFSVDTTQPFGSAADTFVLPLVSDGVINMVVDWGDATTDTITVWNQAEVTHVYAASGTYTIEITGTIRGWRFAGAGDRRKMQVISEWGDFDMTQSNAFQDCQNMTCTAADAPTISTTSLAACFYRCDDLTDLGAGISSWDVSSVTSFYLLFYQDTLFNGDVSSWDVGNVTTFYLAFYRCDPFNQDVSGWDTSSATDMTGMFKCSLAPFGNFDQDLSAWDISGVNNMSDFLEGQTLSTVNYDALLIGWDAQAVIGAQVPDFGTSIYTNCSGAAFTARENLINSDGWTITDGGGTPAICPFTFTVDTTNAGSAADTFVIPLVSDGVISIDVDWGDATTDTITVWNQAEVTHVYAASGTYTVQLGGTIRGFRFSNGGDKEKILDISKWGAMNITQSNTFQGCTNLTATATDAPTIGGTTLGYTFWNCPAFNGVCDAWDVSSVTDMGGTFGYCAFNQPLSSWNTANVTNFTQMFSGNSTFNQDISAWNVAAVSNMSSMFSGCTVFNQNISSWTTTSLTTMSSIFRTCVAFDQPIGSWDVSNVANLSQVFYGCTVFDQDLSSWNTGSVTAAWGTFYNAIAFDQNISAWDVTSLTDASSFFNGVTLSTVNYDALLIGWDAQVLQAGTVFSGGNSVYSCGTAEAARANMIASDTWTITDGGSTPSPCPSPFTFEVDTTQAGSAADTFVVPLVSNGAIDLVIDWGDASSDVIVVWNDPNLTHVYAASGNYTITITATTGTLRGWTFGWGGDKAKMEDISLWGDFEFTNNSAFTQCANMTCTAVDVPPISSTSMAYAFFGCSLINPSSAGSWNVSSCTSINSFWTFCSVFNQDLDGWDVSNVTDFGGVFYGTLCNHPLLNWDTGSGTSFNQMFFGTPFNQDVDMWDMSSALSLYAMFYNCTAFNQDLNSWDTSSVTSMSAVFTGCTVFDGDVSSWNTSSCNNFSFVFQSCPAFDQDISAWNVSTGTNFTGMFRNATVFDQDISGWNVGNATAMDKMFYTATAFNQDISGWNVSSCTNMREMLKSLPSFDQDLGNWDVSSVTNLIDFMSGTTLSTANYDSLLVGWDALVLQAGVVFDGGNSIYTNCGVVAAARTNMITTDTWTITDGGGVPASCPAPFTFTVKTDNAGTSANDQFTIPLVNDGTVLNFVVDWGDATSDTIVVWNDAALTHTYPAAGTYTIEMTGTMGGWRFWWAGDKDKFLEISEWGDWDFTTYGAFAGCSNLTCIATDIPNITGTSLGYTFYSCTNFNGLVAGWSMGAITDINGMFTGCTNFNQPGVIAWDVSSCNGFSATFTNCSVFDQDISGWNTSSSQNMSQMFSGCSLFNQDLDGWDVSGVSNFGSMFQYCYAFSQDLNSWNTSSGTSMDNMFYGITVFNGNITSWDVSSVTNFQNTFNGCTIFAQDLSGWNVTNACTRTIGMFQSAVAFNADITGWDVSNVEYFNSMFRSATSFNQAIGVWNTGTAIGMSNVFRSSTAFDQDISNWDIATVADFSDFMTGITLSTANYDALLVGWEAQTVISGIVIPFGSSTYTLASPAATARAALIAAPNLWTITDGGGV